MPQLIVNTGANGWLFSTQPTTVQSHITQLQVGKQSSGTMRALLRFGLADLPTDAMISSATLQLWQQSPASPNPPQAIYRIKTPWHEDQASWNNRLTGTPWIFPGGDYFSSPSAALQPLAAVAFGGQYIAADVKALAELAVGDSALELLIRNVSEVAGTARAFYDPFTSLQHQPMLTIDYALPPSGRQRLSLGLGVGL